MPVVAYSNGERHESVNLSPDAWTRLKVRYRETGLTMTCGQPGVPKTSPRGMQFFAHKAGANCALHESGPETPEHLTAKAILAETARRLGWTATIEYPAPDRSWIADVLVERGPVRMALEVQWSAQSNREFHRRQQRYEAAGIACRWLVGPRNWQQVDGVPAWRLDGKADALTLELPDPQGVPTALPLTTGIELLLEGAIRPFIEVIVTGVLLTTAMTKCWQASCGRWMTNWWVSAAELKTRCGQLLTLWLEYARWSSDRLEQSLESVIRTAMMSSDLPTPVHYDRRFSKVKQLYYIAQICPHCAVVQGDGLVALGRSTTDYYLPNQQRVPLAKSVLSRPHRCVNNGAGRCVPPQVGVEPRSPTPGTFWTLNSEPILDSGGHRFLTLASAPK